ncbi:helix-turn-helix domain-containing protein [Gemmatimonadota bacterium]
MRDERTECWWLDMEPYALESLRDRISCGDVDALRLYFEMRRPALMDSEDVARILRVSEQTVRNMAYRGELQSVKIGSERNSPLRFEEDAVMELIESRRVGGNGEHGDPVRAG